MTPKTPNFSMQLYGVQDVAPDQSLRRLIGRLVLRAHRDGLPSAVFDVYICVQSSRSRRSGLSARLSDKS